MSDVPPARRSPTGLGRARDPRVWGGLLGDWRVVWALTAVFLALGIEAVIHGRYIHDEGLLTWHFASILGATPIHGLFFQKLRPILALFYAPIAPLGYQAFALTHLLVAAAAIPLVAALSRDLGQRCFVVPAFVVAASPLWLITAVAGHSNCDAAVGILVGVYCLRVHGRPLAAGAILGAMLLVRSEVAPIVALIALEHALRERDLRVVGGLALVPGIYALLGVPYHHDLLWVLHYPPTLVAPAPDTHWLEQGRLGESLLQTSDALLCLSPAVGLALLGRPRALRDQERGLALGLALFVLAIRGFPLVGLFNFDTSPRYLVVGLPALALVLGRYSSEAATPGARPPGFWAGVPAVFALAALAALGFALQDGARIQLLLPAIGVWALVFALPHLLDDPNPETHSPEAPKPGGPRGAKLATALWMSATLASAPLWPERSWLLPQTAKLDALEDWWREHPPDPGAAVLTNSRTARAWLAHGDRSHPDSRPSTTADWHYLFQHDMYFELDQLLHAEVGQRDAIFGAMDRHFYGRPALDLLPSHWAPGTIVIFEDGGRLAETIDLPLWRTYLDLEVEFESDNGAGLLIGRVRATPRETRTEP